MLRGPPIADHGLRHGTTPFSSISRTIRVIISSTALPRASTRGRAAAVSVAPPSALTSGSPGRRSAIGSATTPLAPRTVVIIASSASSGFGPLAMSGAVAIGSLVTTGRTATAVTSERSGSPLSCIRSAGLLAASRRPRLQIRARFSCPTGCSGSKADGRRPELATAPERGLIERAPRSR